MKEENLKITVQTGMIQNSMNWKTSRDEAVKTYTKLFNDNNIHCLVHSDKESTTIIPVEPSNISLIDIRKLPNDQQEETK